jgi:RNA polymerase sigma factor (sigma-70 family)
VSSNTNGGTSKEGEASKTRLTLLGRLRLIPSDSGAWSEFVEWYGSKIYVWCRSWGLQEADAEDVTQEVFLKLSSRMQDFRYDPEGSFRAWLKTVSHHTWQDYLARQKKPGQGSGGDGTWARLSSVEARDDLERWIAAAGDEELLKEAAARVQLRVEPRTWDAFRLLALEGRSGAEAAEILGMKVATLFVARSKVQRMLREELARLDPQ